MPGHYSARIMTSLSSTTMSASTTVDIPESVKAELKKFRYRKASAGDTALVLKIDKKTLTLGIEDTLDGVTPDELAEELPENSPRFVVYSYKLNHKDGRVSFVRFLVYTDALAATLTPNSRWCS